MCFKLKALKVNLLSHPSQTLYLNLMIKLPPLLRFPVLLLASLLSLLPVSTSLHAQLLIEVTEGVNNPTPIAIVPFFYEGTDPLHENLTNVLVNDLTISSQFRLLGNKSMPDIELIETGKVGYSTWAALDIEYVIMGKLVDLDAGTDSRSARYKIRYELFDIVNRASILQNEIVFSEEEYRQAVHRISDAVYEKMTGIKGVFSTKIAYVTVTGDDPAKRLYRLEVADADGARAKVILKSTEPIMSPAWSPDSKKISYVSFELGRSNIYIQNLVTGQRELLSGFKGINGAPAWSPDGKYIALVLSRNANPDIHLVDLATKKVQRLTTSPAIDTEPSWSSDSKRILFTSDRKDGVQIYEMELATKAIKRITYKGRYNARPRYTLKDTSMVMVSQNESGAYNIISQSLITDDRKVLSTSFLDESPSVSANGSHIIFSTKRNDRGILVVVSVDLGIKYYLPYSRGEVREPAWSPFVY